MTISLRVLIVEDTDDDAAILLRELRKGGYTPMHRRVFTRDDMVAALEAQQWDIVISDYAMPQFDGMAALRTLQETGQDLPFIIVSGTIGEDTAVAAMKAGAHDYLMKDNLTRLIPAVERELREAEIRSAHKRAEQTIHHLTYHDSLTGLLNRQEFEHRVAQALENAKLQKQMHALCYLDLDQFKLINDTCGHLAGDELLKQLTILIQAHLRDGDTFARLGGDEFGILLEHCQLNEAKRVANELLELIKKFRFKWQGESFETGASIGLVPIAPESENLAKILSAADVACFTAKDMGRNRIYVYHKADSTLSQRQGEMQMVSRITKAIKEDRFLLYRQSIIEISNPEDRSHCEILLRMIGEDGKILPPGLFLGAAERFNLMPSLDRWVVEKVFETKQKRSAAPGGDDSLRLCAINLSGASLGDRSLLDFIRKKAVHYGIDPWTICFEITETAAITNLPDATHFIHELKKNGFRFALDDFGSGLSSFSYLKNFPVDYLKIDGSFVRDICSDPIDRAMVESINNIGHVMNIKTIAEFVENGAILEKLAEIGVDHAQGYGIDTPQPIDGITRGAEPPAASSK